MIDIKHHPLDEKTDACTGCAACAAACPVDAIVMQANTEGFSHPQINPSLCTGCNRCRHICPLVLSKTARDDGVQRTQPPAVFAGWNRDETIRRESSSGGVFSALAGNILARGGVVAGAAFDGNLVVRHILVDHPTDLPLLRGSKYVQSEIAPSLYRQIHHLLKRNRPVLFSGTPCQVAGLRSFLQTDYPTLWCCDIVCHGVPSPLLLSAYIRHHQKNDIPLKNMTFRDKTTGWKNFGVRHYLQDGKTTFSPLFADPYMVAFLCNYSLRPSCYACAFASTMRSGDLTIADFWGVAKRYPEYDRDDKGTSLLLVNTEKGAAWLKACHPALCLGPADLATAMEGNATLSRSVSRPGQRDTFYQDLKTRPFADMIRKYRLHPPSWLRRAAARLGRRILAGINRIGPRKIATA